MMSRHTAGWSSQVARRAHNPKVVGSNPTPATKASGPFIPVYVGHLVAVSPFLPVLGGFRWLLGCAGWFWGVPGALGVVVRVVWTR